MLQSCSDCTGTFEVIPEFAVRARPFKIGTEAMGHASKPASRPEDSGEGGGGHDHGPCLQDALARARMAFDGKNMKLTPLRQKVFEEIAGSHDAVGAYDVLDRMARKSGDRMAPISVYRAIDALLAAGVVHRLRKQERVFCLSCAA